MSSLERWYGFQFRSDTSNGRILCHIHADSIGVVNLRLQVQISKCDLVFEAERASGLDQLGLKSLESSLNPEL